MSTARGTQRGIDRTAPRRWESRLRNGARRALWRAVERRVAVDPASAVGEEPPLFILFTGRSGSHFLAGLLHSIPGVATRGEVLHPSHLRPRTLRRLVGPYSMRFSTPALAAAYVAHEMATLETPVRGARFQPRQLERAGARVGDLDTAFPGARYLVLYRRTLAEQYVSGEIARRTRRWSWYQGRNFEPFTGRIRVDPEHFERWRTHVTEGYRSFLEEPAVRERGVLLCYEDLVADAQAVFERSIFPLLSRAPCPVASGWQKMNARSLPDVVENWSDVSALLQGPDADQHYRLP